MASLSSSLHANLVQDNVLNAGLIQEDILRAAIVEIAQSAIISDILDQPIVLDNALCPIKTGVDFVISS